MIFPAALIFSSEDTSWAGASFFPPATTGKITMSVASMANVLLSILMPPNIILKTVYRYEVSLQSIFMMKKRLALYVWGGGGVGPQSMLKKGNVQLVTKKIEELTGQINLNIQHIVNNQSIFSTSNSVPESENIINFRQEIKTEIYQEQPVQKIQEPVKIQFQEKQIRKHPQLFEKYTFAFTLSPQY